MRADWQIEIEEWQESLAAYIEDFGAEKAKALFTILRRDLLKSGIALDTEAINTPYLNTIPVAEQPLYPGDITIEKRIENILRWNAMCMVLQGVDEGKGVGGHIATYASIATLFEVGLHHFFRKKTETYGGDLVSFQPHAAPGIYARALLEGRLSLAQLKNYRRELREGGGLCSYPHPRRMPDFWEIPSASMGLVPVSGIYQARFRKYLENRGLKPKNGGKVWVFVGDGEMDEPEVLGAINIAVREELDNFVLVVNCNLQRLDGPVRGNGKIIQELERSFLGSGWNVIKVIWGGEWDSLLSRDKNGILLDRMERALDGDYQMYSVLDGKTVRAHWVENNAELEAMMRSLTDEDIKEIKRGGHDPQKIYAAFHRAQHAKNRRPTVILAKTIKGYGMGSATEGRNTAHQRKNMDAAERIACARKWGIPISDEAAAQAQFYLPPDEAPEVQYLRARRRDLGGFLPARNNQSVGIPALSPKPFEEFKQGSGGREISTTMVMVKLLSNLLKAPDVGAYIVPIIPDEARTFGMDSLFKVAGIYHPQGQLYKPVDAGQVSYYRESTEGQILQEGICEAGAMASFMAAGTAYSVLGIPSIPFYIFYSMFGFQRVGDMIWACGDMMAKGFLLGGTAGRTTLNGEGVQHQDGHSLLLASTVPNLRIYDPAFGYELAHIIHDGMERMYIQDEKIFYYLTIYNENLEQPAQPEGIEEGILKGMYCFKKSTQKKTAQVHLLGSGSLMCEVMQAWALLEELGISTHLWSVTSYAQLMREAQEVERQNLLHPSLSPKTSYIEGLLEGEQGIVVSVSDYMRSWGGSIARWVKQPFVILGTDGYGLSESREDLRDYFEVSAKYIVWNAAAKLYALGQVSEVLMQTLAARFQIMPDKPNPTEV